tara:strand:+ start:1894 stop:2730 length:837 start_codon:yes stop_codon:yes gene_type:complete
MYFGIVKSLSDPLKLGRVQVKVYDLHDKIKTEDLTWSQVMMPANTPAINGTGHSVNLAVGSLVCGIFLDGMMQEFMVLGSLPTKTDGVEDNNVRVRAEADPHAAETRGTYQPASTYAPEYPFNNVMATESGHVKEYDDTPGLERITERHMSGTQYEVCADGTKNETIVRDNYRLVVGQDTLEVFGDVRVIISGHADVAVAGNLTASVAGNIAADSSGDITLKTNDATKKIILDGEVSVTENLVVEKLTTTSNSTTPIALDTHTHDDFDSPTVQTGTPN